MGRLSKRSKAMKEAWKRRKAEKLSQEITGTVTKKKTPVSFSKESYTIEQLRELGLVGITNDGADYRLLIVDGRPYESVTN